MANMNTHPIWPGLWGWESYSWMGPCLVRTVVEIEVTAALPGFCKSLILIDWPPPTGSSSPDCIWHLTPACIWGLELSLPQLLVFRLKLQGSTVLRFY